MSHNIVMVNPKERKSYVPNSAGEIRVKASVAERHLYRVSGKYLTNEAVKIFPVSVSHSLYLEDSDVETTVSTPLHVAKVSRANGDSYVAVVSPKGKLVMSSGSRQSMALQVFFDVLEDTPDRWLNVVNTALAHDWSAERFELTDTKRDVSDDDAADYYTGGNRRAVESHRPSPAFNVFGDDSE